MIDIVISHIHLIDKNGKGVDLARPHQGRS